jgi:hypothetical protein
VIRLVATDIDGTFGDPTFDRQMGTSTLYENSHSEL